MGQKRKASDSPPLFSIASLPSSAESAVHHSFHAPPPHDTHLHTTSNDAAPTGWTSPDAYYTAGVPNSSTHAPTPDTNANHLNSRTRKRFRDNRPDESTIHQNTLSKLYSAQRRASKTDSPDNAMPLLPSSPTPSRPRLASLASSSSATNTTPTSQQQRQKSQASLHAFFGGSGGGGGGGGEVWPAQYLLADNPQSNSHPSATLATCEDCAAPLLHHATSVALDTEMMDLDTDLRPSVISSSSGGGGDGEGDAYSCAQCGKRVCDTCAVRGDWRMCLECANPGSGYGRGGMGGVSCGVEAGQGGGGGGAVEKRWVGGIGWL